VSLLDDTLSGTAISARWTYRLSGVLNGDEFLLADSKSFSPNEMIAFGY
jgi:hypothetical protein